MFRVHLISLVSLFVLLFVFYGCSHKVVAPTATTVEIHSSYEERIPGNWAIIIDESSTNFERDVSPSSHECSAHSFVFNPGESINLSTISALKKAFDNTKLEDRVPSLEVMKRENLIGYAIVELEGFNPRIVCRDKFWSIHCTVEVELEFGVDVKGTDGKLLGTSVGSRKSVDGGSGAFCGSISELFGEAFRLALSDSLEEMVEEISNSSRIRDYTKNQSTGNN